ncbi:MAG: ABC transporter permease [Candidatus Omnitrophica bacterium]|nr:ABC transporter permease [Candidatus Omnitrophota bacterium]
MIRYLIRRVLGSIPVLLGISVISFAVIHLAPGKPVTIEQSLNPRVSQEVRLKLEKLYGLDRPLHVQYVNWMKTLLKLDFGRSFIDDRPVVDKIIERLPVTLTINLCALFLILACGIPLGVTSALKQGTFFDRMTGIYVFVSFAVPTFWLALLLMNLLGVQLRWLPASGIKSLDFEYFTLWQQLVDYARHLLLPVCVSALAGIAGIARYMRANMIQTLQQPYVQAARAKGLSEKRVLYKHALRNAVLPIVTILGLSIPGLLGGSVIFEQIFAIPGIGRLFFEAVMTRDYPLIMASVVLGAVLTMLGNLVADISYACVDPRIRYK